MNAKGLLQKKYVRMLVNAFTAWWNDQAPSKGAALAYYSMFSIAPLLYLIISIAGLVVGPDAVRGMVFEQVAALMGQSGAEAIREMLAHVSEPKTGAMTTAVSIAVLLFSASSVFGQLQTALDTIWRVPESTPLVGAFGLRFLRLDVARVVVCTELLSRRKAGQCSNLVEANAHRIPGRLLPLGNAVTSHLPGRQAI